MNNSFRSYSPSMEKGGYPYANYPNISHSYYVGAASNSYQDFEQEGGFKSWVDKHRKLLFVGLALIGLAAIGGTLGGVLGTQLNTSEGSSGGSDAGSKTSSSGDSFKYLPGSARVVKVDPHDMSNFEKDERLHRSFYGLAYTPMNAVPPNCYATQANVTEDVMLMSQLSTLMRTYASGCNQTNLVLQAIQDTKVNMSVFLGVYVSDDDLTNTQQVDDTIDALKTYGADHVMGITVGNEYILDSSDQDQAVQTIIKHVGDMKSKLQSLNLPKEIPVGTADAGSVITRELAANVDYVMANVHPWFGKLKVEEGAAWTSSYFEETDVSLTEGLDNNPDSYIAETGWPTNSMTPQNLTNGGAVAGNKELQTFLDTFVCEANSNGTGYFYFEVFDEPWKREYGGVEPYWGLFDSNKRLKDIQIPDCVFW